jgi:hypothetical protein
MDFKVLQIDNVWSDLKKLVCFRNIVDNTGQQNLTFFFVPRGKIYNPDSTFNAEFKHVSSFSPSPTVCL